MTNYPFINKNGKYRPNLKEWSDTKANIMQVKKQLNISDDEFRMLSPYENHQGIQEKIYQTFCHLEKDKRSIWLWHNLKKPFYCFDYFDECYLEQLIQPTEKIWFVVADCFSGKHKLWLFEGNILTIQKLLTKIRSFDEIYFVSKKFEWLICVNHADTIIATGGDMPQKLADLHKQILAKEN